MRMPFTHAQVRALDALLRLWKAGPTCVLVGAGAIHCHRELARRTQDLDLAVAVSLDELPLGLDRLEGWRQHPQHEHQWLGPGDVRLDVMPAGSALTAVGHIDWASGHRMNVAGFEHVFSNHRPLDLGTGRSLPVAELAVIALLKMVAYLDRGAIREHDLQDLGFIIEEYSGVDDPRRWTDEVIDRQIPYELVGAFLLGRDLGAFMTHRDRANFARFGGLVRDDRDATLTRWVRLAPTAWGRTGEAVLERLDMLTVGLGDRVVEESPR